MKFQLSITIIVFMLFTITTKSTSKYEGVSWNEFKKRWQVEFDFNGKNKKYYFDNELDAVKTRNRAYKKMKIPDVLNQQTKAKKSQYNCVFWGKQNGKWYVKIQFKGEKEKYFGSFIDELDAAKKVNQICEEKGIPHKNSGIGTIPTQQYQVKEQTSQYFGVCWHKRIRKWLAQLKLQGEEKNKYFGAFDEELDAAKKVNQICEEHGIHLKNPGIGMIPTQQGKKKSSKYKGVHWNKLRNQWYVQLRSKDGRKHYGANFDDELDAAKKVNQMCEEYGMTAKNPGISGAPNQQIQRIEKSSQYKGVCWSKRIKRWCAVIRLKTDTRLTQKYGGSFSDELDAAKRVNELCEEFGIPIQNQEIDTHLTNGKTLIDHDAMQVEFGSMINILGINNNPSILTIKENLIAAINYGDKAKMSQINSPTENGESALSIAAKHGFANVVKFLISKGANKEHFTKEHHTPLSLAVSKNHIKVVQALFEDWISPNSHEDPYLHLSPIFNVKSREMTQLLADNDAVTNGIYNNKNQSPLTVACQNGYLDVVEFFLDDELDINHLDNDNKTPLFYALTNKHQEVANLLISKGAKNGFLLN